MAKSPSIGVQIRLAREAQGKEQSELSRAVGIQQATLSRFESDRRAPNLRHLSLLAKELGATFHIGPMTRVS